MTAHALWISGWALLALSLVIFTIALAERASERRAVKVPVRSQKDQRR